MTRAEKYAADREKLMRAIDTAHTKLQEGEPEPFAPRGATLMTVGEHGEIVVHDGGRRHLTSEEITAMMDWLAKWFVAEV